MIQMKTVVFLIISISLTYGYYESPTEEKDFKRILKQNKNVLVLSSSNEQTAKSILQIFKQIEKDIRGRGLLVHVNCEKAKKLCKKFKLDTADAELRHFQDGEFHKVYDRSVVAKSMISFMLDPKGEAPWNEDPLADSVVHLENPKDLQKALKQSLPLLVMFYAPWCGFCKKLKPEYAEAAREIHGQYVLAGMDCDRMENNPIRRQFNITGYPTLIYFEKGEEKYKYSSGYTKEDIINWLKDPQPPKESSKDEDEEQEDFFPNDPNNVNYIVHLNDTTFPEFIAEKKQSPILVMFYAPWCGHCKNIKPELIQASIDLHNEESNAIIVAIDGTKAPALSKQYKIQGFPTLKFFRPKEPPPPEPEWSEQETDVLHLTDENFKTILKKKKSALVFFYAPWCGHCKRAKPLFTNAAAAFKENPKVAFCAVDCTKSQSICKEFEIQGYPSIKYFNFGKFAFDYAEERTEEAFIALMKNPEEKSKKADPTPPPSDPVDFWKDSAPGYENVHMLTTNTFDSIIGSSQKALIMFYAPWCGHCRNAKPVVASVASQLAAKSKDIIVGAIDVTNEKDLAAKYSVQYLPTFKYFENGQLASDYSGGRNEEDILQFLTGSARNTEL